MQFEIKGKVLERKTGQGSPGLHVEAWDRMLDYPKPLGQATTDAQGAFEIRPDEARMTEAFRGRPVELFVQVFRDGRNHPIAHTLDTAVWRDAEAVQVVAEALGTPTSEKDFFQKDYELKINYLSEQFQRMWTRFNFFLTLESGLIGVSFLVGNGKLSRELTLVSLVLSAVWYIFGAEDRYLVRVYRKQVEDAARRWAETTWPGSPLMAAAYIPVGEVERTIGAMRLASQGKTLWRRLLELEWLSGWRIPAISITRLAALFPLAVFVVWLLILFLYPFP